MSETEINKYQNGKVYKILNTINDEVYVGSTYQSLSKRMTKHRHDSKSRPWMIYQLTQQLGIEHFYIVLIEDYPCKTKDELTAREGHWIRQIGTLNSKIAGRTDKQYNEDNKDKISEYRKVYKAANKDYISEKGKEYYNKNIDHIKAYEKIYRLKNKDKIDAVRNISCVCSCGGKYTVKHKNNHLKSLKHQAYEENLVLEG